MKILIDKQTVIWILLIAPFMRPNGIAHIIPFMDRVYLFAMIASLLLLIVDYMAKPRSDFSFIVLIGILLVWMIGITIIKGGVVSSIGKIAIMLFGTALCVEVMISNPKKMFNAFLTNFEILIYLNFILLLLFPNGLYVSESTGNWNNWLLGYDNHWFIVYFVAYYVAVMNAKMGGSVVRMLLLILVLHISTFITMSGVLIVGILILDVFLISRLYERKFFDMKFVLGIGILSFVGLTFFYNSSIINYIIGIYLDKTGSLTARLRIWNITWEYISNNPIFGYGRLPTDFRTSMYNNPHGVNSHSMWLEILFEGGIVAFVLFCTLLVLIYKKMSRCRKSFCTGFWNVALMACIVTLSVDSAFELRGAMFFWLLSVGYHMKALDQIEPLKSGEYIWKRKSI